MLSDPDPGAERLVAGTRVLAGNRLVEIDAALADAYRPGDELLAIDGRLVHLSAADLDAGRGAVARAHDAFLQLAGVTDESIDRFFHGFADRLADDAAVAPILEANAADVARARDAGRSTTRLVLSPQMRSDMVAGLRTWATQPSGRGEIVRTVEHDGWTVELVRAGLGVVGFVFEGRPNVFADACGVLRSGNTVAFRIGSDALGTARAIMEHALRPALAEAGLPLDAASLVDSRSHGAGHAMFSDQRLALAVARGSGPAVAQLGAVARQAGVAVSLHGTGGAWIVAGEPTADTAFADAVRWSLDRKVCNTLNTCCIPLAHADRLVPVFLESLDAAAAARGTEAKLHLCGEHAAIGPDRMAQRTIIRAEGASVEPGCEPIDESQLGREWEWEESPEVTLVIVDDLDHAIDLFNARSPRFVASLVSSNPDEHARFWDRIDAPFVGDGFTRWVDGQYALDAPELGLSNWQGGRLLARGGILSGDSVFTVRTRVRQTRSDVHR